MTGHVARVEVPEPIVEPIVQPIVEPIVAERIQRGRTVN
jgi:hypothetical protein